MASTIYVRAAFGVAVVSFLLSSASSAFADVPTVTIVRQRSEAPGEDGGSEPPPRPRHGFQMAMRAGYAAPLGAASGTTGDDLSRYFFGGQGSILVDLGGKVSDESFWGIYTGIGFGGSTQSFRFGIQGQRHFLPNAKANPWFGYGIGLEIANSSSALFLGLELPNFALGCDFRLNKTIGLGPVLSLAFGRYLAKSIYNNPIQEIENTGVHLWLDFGARMVLFP